MNFYRQNRQFTDLFKQTAGFYFAIAFIVNKFDKIKAMTNAQFQSLNYDDYIDTTAIFGEVKKSIISKTSKAAR